MPVGDSDDRPGGGRIASLGSVNVDRIRTVSDADLAALAERYDWFPDRGQTVRVADVPDDVAAEADEIRHGGKGANQAVAAAAAGAETAMLGKVGTDHGEFGVLAALRDAGVGVDRIGVAPEPTGTAYVFVSPAGDNRIVVSPGANGTVDRSYLRGVSDAVLGADCLLLQNEIPPEPVAALLADLAAEPDRPTVLLDPAPADGVEALLGTGVVDYLTPNETEYETLRSHLDAFDGVLVRKRGGDDVVVEAERRFAVTPPRVRAVDTTGAGDVLNGFLAAQLAAGTSLQEAVEVATVAGALSTREAGARGGIPTMDEVRAFRASGGA